MGNLEKSEDQNTRLLVIYMMYHFKKKTPILVHENVIGFIATEMSDQAVSFGYDTFTIRVKPMDVGFHVGRPRRWGNCTILYVFFETTFVYVMFLVYGQIAIRNLGMYGMYDKHMQ